VFLVTNGGIDINTTTSTNNQPIISNTNETNNPRFRKTGNMNIKTSKSSKIDLQIIRSAETNSPTTPATFTHKIERPQLSIYERIVYALDILIQPEEAEDMEVPIGHFLQKVIVGQKWKWRISKDVNANLPTYLTEHKDLETNYRVITEEESFFPMFDPTSKFIRQWDALALILLLYTASVTPFETA
jgi:hypothetical protein